jgi:hypothetical protein
MWPVPMNPKMFTCPSIVPVVVLRAILFLAGKGTANCGGSFISVFITHSLTHS